MLKTLLFTMVGARRGRGRRWGVWCVCGVLGLMACEEEQTEATTRKSLVNPDVYQSFFAHYPFGGHPVQTWITQLNALAPGGAAAHPAGYQLARRRADLAGLVVSGDGQQHTVKIRPDLITQLIEQVDQEKESP